MTFPFPARLLGGGGSQSFNTPGNHVFVTPESFSYITFKLYGGGGGGGGVGTGSSNGQAGGPSAVVGMTIAGGAGGGKSGANGGAGGAGGVPSGYYNQAFPGPAGASRSGTLSGKGGDCPEGGLGGAAMGPASAHGLAGGAPGGGGSGALSSSTRAGGGGAGAYAEVMFVYGQLERGQPLQLTVGAGGNGGSGTYQGGRGADGRVVVTWQ